MEEECCLTAQIMASKGTSLKKSKSKNVGDSCLLETNCSLLELNCNTHDLTKTLIETVAIWLRSYPHKTVAI